MSKKNPAKLEVKPVAWAGEIVTKYQGFITVTRPDGKEKVMTGEPFLFSTLFTMARMLSPFL